MNEDESTLALCRCITRSNRCRFGSSRSFLSAWQPPLPLYPLFRGLLSASLLLPFTQPVDLVCLREYQAIERLCSADRDIAGCPSFGV